MIMLHHPECLVRNFERAVLVYWMHQLVNPQTKMIVNASLNYQLDLQALFPYHHLNVFQYVVEDLYKVDDHKS